MSTRGSDMGSIRRRIVCTQCGNAPDWPDSKTEGFCAMCGSLITADAPAIREKKSKPPGKAAWMLLGGGISALLFIALSLLMFSSVIKLSGDETRHEGPGFDTPEDAAAAYLESLKALDLDAMVSAYAIETYTDNYDGEAYLRQTKMYYANQTFLIPAGFAFDMGADIRNLELKFATYINIMALFISWNGSPIDYGYILFEDDGEIDRFIQEIQGNDFADTLTRLEVLAFIHPEDLHGLYTSESVQTDISNTKKISGADELTDVAVIIRLDGEELLFTASAARYGDRWYLFSPGGKIGNLIGMYYPGGIVRMDGLYLSDGWSY